jgi:putative phosphoesterase
MKEASYLVLSDTHGATYAIKGVLEQLNFRPRGILFLGDVLDDLKVLEEEPYAGMDIYAVRGNCDFFANDVPATRMVDLDGCRVLLMHGHTCGVDGGHTNAIQSARMMDADVLLFGHTHKKCCYTVSGEGGKGLLVGNPGSLSNPRDGGEPSFGVLTVRGGVPLFSHGERL